MRVLLAPASDRKEYWFLQPMDDDGRPVAEPIWTREPADAVRRLEVDRPRWVWTSTARVHPLLLRAGVRVDRCHDLAMTEALLRAHEKRPAPATSGWDAGDHTPNAQISLFDDNLDQIADENPGRPSNPAPNQQPDTNQDRTPNPTSDGNPDRATDEKANERTDGRPAQPANSRPDGPPNQPADGRPAQPTDEQPDGRPNRRTDAPPDEQDQRTDEAARPAPDRQALDERADEEQQAKSPDQRTGEPPDENTDEISRLLAEHTDQLARIQQARVTSPGFGLLVAAESAAALAAVEMGRAGLPWRADVHDRVLTELLGERPRHGGRPPKLQELAVAVAEALEGDAGRRPGGPRAGGAPGVNVDSPLEVLRAFRRQGVQLETTRAWELKTVDHPAVEPLLRYKELARLHSANGWAWREQWVHDGRFRPEYIVGGVVSGRWATKGGGALQIPRAVRASVVADPGWALVVADAGQLEPRILAALSGDPGMVAATQAGDLYAALATQALGRSDARDEAKIALLAAMYGARANTPAMAALTRRFPQALDLLEAAARTGEDGGIVRSVLGRTCPPPSPNWQQGPDAVLLARSRARGRFTRNFVIQASAADWANTLVAGLRRRLIALEPDGEPGPELVFFQHDEVVVHTPQAQVDAVIAAITTSGQEATRLVVGERGVRIPFTATPVASYADKH